MQYYYKAAPRQKAPAKVKTLSLLPASSNSTPKGETSVAEAALQAEAEVITISRESHSVLLSATEAQREIIEVAAGIKLHPNHSYHVAALHEALVASASATTAQTTGPYPYEFVVEDSNGTAVVGARVVVCLDNDLSAIAETDATGIAHFFLNVEETADVHVLPRENYWCTSVPDSSSSAHQRKLIVEPIVVPYPDSARHFYPQNSPTAGKGIKVAVIDTGIDAHKDLPALSIKKTVLKGMVTDGCEDNWMGHGTHVAGIIAGRRFGIAPSVDLMGYCVFPKGQENAESLDISTAIDLAVEAGAQVINLSIGWNYCGQPDEPVLESIKNAVEAGVIVVAATGNDGVDGVLFPSSMDCVCAVGAIGVANKFAPTSTHRFHKKRIQNSDGEFVAHFSNFQEQMVQMAAPGLAVVSTAGTSGYSAKSGTSMATPIISGIAAKILSEHPELQQIQGNERVTKLKELLYNDCDDLGFDKKYVGVGVPAYGS